MARRSRRGNSVEVDFTGVEGRRKLVPEGEYEVEVTACELKPAKKSGESNVAWELKVINDKKFEGSKLYLNTSLQPQALWKLKSTIEALGQEVPDGAADIDFDEFVGATAVAVVVHEDYQGEPKARVSYLDALEEEEKPTRRSAKDDEDDDEKPTRKSTKRGAKDDDEDEKPARRRAKDDDDDDEKPTSRKARGDDDDDEKPARSAKKNGKLAVVTEDEVTDLNEDDLEKLVAKYKLDIDLGDFKTLRKMHGGVLDALEEAGHLEK